MTYTNLITREIETRIHLADTIGLIEEIEDYINSISEDIYNPGELANIALEKKCWLIGQLEEQEAKKGSIAYPAIILVSCALWYLIINSL